ncbi:hypothetical protein BJ508DRAFT_344266 [Ascobolus immersus RN42]|uniref:Uncharacterized protein n=1 Tax=Ascobolus immersus RN42 TaxID=1160509 RepID=A0A3N4IDY5_ASCIM|nr:hypothetical protein BJ508DRAFT_344266 [Ascobolus immersus RN42]
MFAHQVGLSQQLHQSEVRFWLEDSIWYYELYGAITGAEFIPNSNVRSRRSTILGPRSSAQKDGTAEFFAPMHMAETCLESLTVFKCLAPNFAREEATQAVPEGVSRAPAGSSSLESLAPDEGLPNFPSASATSTPASILRQSLTEALRDFM